MSRDETARRSVRPELAAAEPTDAVPASEGSPDLVMDSVVSEPLRAVMQAQPRSAIGVVIQLRTTIGTRQARERLAGLVAAVTKREGEVAIDRGSPYATVSLTPAQIRRLVASDSADIEGDEPTATKSSRAPRGCIHRMWPNFEISGLLLGSGQATKCTAAQRTFDAHGHGIVWAVLDSGIDANHAHFAHHANLEGLPPGLASESFVTSSSQDALSDGNGHGTHVAGIIAGGLAPGVTATGVGWYRDASGSDERRPVDVSGISGMAPACKLLSCKVLRDDRTGDVTALLDALLYIQELNENGRNLRVHGVNISVGHMFDPAWFAAGLTPVCQEVDRLVASGVVVVVAAGNTGYGYAKDPNGRSMRLGFDTTINDPGNAARAITVGSTSSSPHRTGVSYFSSKGPTGDGRMKPDLVAPGERIISAAAGLLLDQAHRADQNATYIESSGTSMAAPHVAGAAAGFLSVKREFIGQPDRVKQVLMSSATDLGRAQVFQGAGMLDAMRALQSL
jgi:subtilisin family serine protease